MAPLVIRLDAVAHGRAPPGRALDRWRGQHRDADQTPAVPEWQHRLSRSRRERAARLIIWRRARTSRVLSRHELDAASRVARRRWSLATRGPQDPPGTACTGWVVRGG